MDKGEKMDVLENVLSKFDKAIYLESLIVVSKSDGKVLPVEKQFIETQASLLGVETDAYWKSEIDDISHIDTSKLSNLTKRIIIRDCISLGYIDGDFDDSERQDIYSISDLFNIEHEVVDKIENWLCEYWVLLKKGNELIGLP